MYLKTWIDYCEDPERRLRLLDDNEVFNRNILVVISLQSLINILYLMTYRNFPVYVYGYVLQFLPQWQIGCQLCIWP